MLPRERIEAAFAHKEADRIPIDFASTIVTGIHKIAYDQIAEEQGWKRSEKYSLMRGGLVEPSEECLKKVGSDVRGVWPNKLGEDFWPIQRMEDDKAYYVIDEWGVRWKKLKKDGYYYDVCRPPVMEEELDWDIVKGYQYPCLDNEDKFAGMRERAEKIYHDGYAIFLENPMTEIIQSQTRILGFQNFFTNLMVEPEMIEYMMAETEEKLEAYFKRALEELKGLPVIARLSDDLGSQSSFLFSPELYRQKIKPLHKKLIDSIHKNATADVKIFFHSDGAIKGLIPDLIEIGVDALNPIQYTCTGMDSQQLKKEFGKDICFWGGGIDTATVLTHGTAAQIRDEVRRQIEILAPGGGFVFSQIHNIQPGISPDKFWAIWETAEKYGYNKN